MIDAYGSLPHFRDHLAPIWRALPEEERGTFWTPRSLRRDAWLNPRPCLVASASDYVVMKGRPIGYVEHGAGQTYRGDARGAESPSYAGGPGFERVRLFVVPGRRTAASWASRYDAPIVVGSPRLEQLAALPEPLGRPCVAFTWHWACGLLPETKTALPHYHGRLAAIVEELRGAGVDVVGHAHPRIVDQLIPIYGKLRVELLERFDQVVQRAHVLVADNTSALYEWAALDRPCVVLNAPWYRRDVDHGLRFWSQVPGEQVDGPEEVVGAVLRAVTADPARGLRRAAAAAVYAPSGGAAARAAAAAVEALT